MQTKMITLKEAAVRIGRSQSTIRNWLRGTYTKGGKTHLCSEQFVQAYKFGKQYAFKESDINRWVAEHAEPARD